MLCVSLLWMSISLDIWFIIDLSRGMLILMVCVCIGVNGVFGLLSVIWWLSVLIRSRLFLVFGFLMFDFLLSVVISVVIWLMKVSIVLISVVFVMWVLLCMLVSVVLVVWVRDLIWGRLRKL